MSNNALQWNVKSCKKSMKRLKRPNSLFLQGEVSSAVLKTWKTRETKTRITQNFQILNHIQGTTIGKLTSWGFRKCGSFWRLELLNHSYQPPKSGQNPEKKFRHRACHKKWMRAQFFLKSLFLLRGFSKYHLKTSLRRNKLFFLQKLTAHHFFWHALCPNFFSGFCPDFGSW